MWGLRPVVQDGDFVQQSFGCSPPIPTRLSGATRAIDLNRVSGAGALDETSYGLDVAAGL